MKNYYVIGPNGGKLKVTLSKDHNGRYTATVHGRSKTLPGAVGDTPKQALARTQKLISGTPKRVQWANKEDRMKTTDDFLKVKRLHEVTTKGGKATVQVFLMVLSSKLVQSDAAQSKRDMKRGIPTNIYALGHMLKAKDQVEADVKAVLHNDDEASLRKLQKSLKHRFNEVSPVKYTIKAIDSYIATGKIPKISGKGGAAPAWK